MDLENLESKHVFQPEERISNPTMIRNIQHYTTLHGGRT